MFKSNLSRGDLWSLVKTVGPKLFRYADQLKYFSAILVLREGRNVDAIEVRGPLD